MSKTKSPRKRYRPRVARLDNMRIALGRASALTAPEVEQIMGPTRASLEALRTGQADSQDWAHLSEAAGIGLDLSALGICSDPGSVRILAAMYKACGTIAERSNRTGRLLANGPELTAISDGLGRHAIQLEHCSAGELSKAVRARKAALDGARAGRMPIVTLNELKERGEVPA